MQSLFSNFRPSRLLIIALLALGAVALSWHWQHWVRSESAVADAAETTHGPKDAAGRWLYSNHLTGQNSPYLLLHAHNPVDWYPWGDEALAKARSEDKPIFLSIGYSTCYWCHVMERLVFSNPEIAAQMNEHFVNIKVDREERPDIDRIYMTATQLLNRHGGWPNSIFLTPNLEPFFAGTYFPPEDAHGRPGFPRVLDIMQREWSENRGEVERIASKLTEAISELEAGQQSPPMQPDSISVERVLVSLRGRYDGLNGGFGGAPKFPPYIRLNLLMAQSARLEDELFRRIALHSLEAMAHGGITDHVGGGVHRYATDAGWQVPHFEKMLYSQAQLTQLYVRAYALTGQERWRRAAAQILSFVEREMTAKNGAFFSALDAETEGEEGRYYLWTEREILEVLGDDAALFMQVYALAPMPEGDAGVLYIENAPDAVATELELETGELYAHLDAMRSALGKARRTRVYPLVDDKAIAAWNGMMIGAYAYAYEILKEPAYRRAAERAAEFVLEHMRRSDGSLLRVERAGQAQYDGYLDDYAFMIEGLLALHQATGDAHWLGQTQALADQMLARFWDGESGGFFFSQSAVDLIVRSKSAQDGALPSGNAVAVHALLDLARATGEIRYQQLAQRTLYVFGGMMRAQPEAFVHMVAAVERLEGPQRTSANKMATASDSIVHMQVRRTAGPNGREGVAVDLKIRAGWHINAQPARGNFIIPTSLTLNADTTLEDLALHYPPGQVLFFPALEETLAVYSGQVALAAEWQITPTNQGALRLLVQYQACDDSRCLPPAELRYSMPLEGE